MEVVIIRAPLVYGPNAPGNFGKLMWLVHKNLPLPLGRINNKRSFVFVDNLVDLIITCIDHPRAAGHVFLVSDDHDVSTTKLLRSMACAAGKTPWLIPVPLTWLNGFANIIGKRTTLDKLCGNLQVDVTHTKEVLGWHPPVSFEDGIRRCFQGN
jgi:UDP-glucose 4-epimerase